MIGREREISELLNILESNKSEFVAVYGRRRVGKTYLIDETFRNYIVFRHTGLPPIYDTNNEVEEKRKLTRQLEAFYQTLKLYDCLESNDNMPTTWIEAFGILTRAIKRKYDNKRIVLFIDELPWMDTPKSYFLEAFTHFWNNYCCFNHNIILVVCGSSSSWILDNVIHSHGGLYGRVTFSLKLMPFNLKETKEYLSSIGVNYSDYDVATAYMAVGGIPYYLSFFRRGLSLAQNFDNIFFNKQPLLGEEYEELFSSQFTNHERFKKIIEILKEKKSGLSAKAISEKLDLSLNSNLYDMLRSLEKGSFIMTYNSFGEAKNERRYRLIDPFCLFYLNVVKDNIGKNKYWETYMDNQNLVVWKGLAFENVCFNHIDKIKEKLGISWMATNELMWYQKPTDEQSGVQIDLLIERKDNIVNLCEAKYVISEYRMTKKDHLDLMDKMEILRSKLNKRISIMNVLITTYGIRENEYSRDYVNVVTLDDLFK